MLGQLILQTGRSNLKLEKQNLINNHNNVSLSRKDTNAKSSSKNVESKILLTTDLAQSSVDGFIVSHKQKELRRSGLQ